MLLPTKVSLHVARLTRIRQPHAAAGARTEATAVASASSASVNAGRHSAVICYDQVELP